MSNWTIFSNHGHVLFCLARDPEARLRDVAADVGLTERAVQKIVRDLQASGMIIVSKHGRRNRYRIDSGKSLRHDLEAHCTLDALIGLVVDESGAILDSAIPVSETPIEQKQLQPAAPEPMPIDIPELGLPEEDGLEEDGSEEDRPEEDRPEEDRPEEDRAEEDGPEEDGPVKEEPKVAKPVKPDSKADIQRQQCSLF